MNSIKYAAYTRPALGICVALICLALLGQPLEAAQASKHDLYALIVGMKIIDDDPKQVMPTNPGATELRDFLAERRHLFHDVKIALLVDQMATKANVIKVLTTELTKARKEDVVLIFLEGHGTPEPGAPGEFYFKCYDSRGPVRDTWLRVNDKKLFQGIKSEKLVFLTGSCFSGGFLEGLARSLKQGLPTDFLGDFLGRFGMSAAKANETAVIPLKLGTSLFAFYLMKGLRGGADQQHSGKITVKQLYDFVEKNVVAETGGQQHPQMFIATSDPANTAIYQVPRYDEKLKIDVKFFYETDDHQLKLLTEGAELKSGQHLGIAFKPGSDCFVQIFWRDSSGKVGRLFPRPDLTEGTGEAKGGRTVWLPTKGGKHWYVLDKTPGTDTIYFMASRERNPKLEELFTKLQALGKDAQRGGEGSQVSQQIQREIDLMGIEDTTVPVEGRRSYGNSEQLFVAFENELKVSGLDAVYRVQFKHKE